MELPRLKVQLVRGKQTIKIYGHVYELDFSEIVVPEVKVKKVSKKK